MSGAKQITILLATYNGERFLRDQLESFVRQTYQSWYLIARDDGSSDNTSAILAEFAQKFPEKVSIDTEIPRNLGFAANFSRLMQLAPLGWFMPSDQDDVWLPDKLAVYAEQMAGMEAEMGEDVPILIYSLVRVVDENLDVIEKYADFKYFLLRSADFFQLLNRNVAVGATCMGNASLLRFARPVPAEIGLHDWWLVLVAAALGRTKLIHQESMLYRQHGRNLIGAGVPSHFWQTLRKPHWAIASMIRRNRDPNRPFRWVAKRRMVSEKHQRLAIIEQRFTGQLSPQRAAEIAFVLRGKGLRRWIYAAWELWSA